MTPPRVEISYPEEKTVKGTLVNVLVSIPEGWHVNANVAADKFLKPSTLDIEARGIEFDEPIWPAPSRNTAKRWNSKTWYSREPSRFWFR